MKKWFALLMITLLLTITNAALAVSWQEWAEQCSYRIRSGRAPTVYDLVEIATTTDLGENKYELKSIGHISSSNPYIKVLDAEYGGMVAVRYMDGAGSICTGYIDPGEIVSTLVTLDIGLEFNVQVPESISSNAAAIAEYVEKKYGYVMDPQSILQYWNSTSGSGGSDGDQQENSGSSSGGYVAPKVQTGTVRLVDENGEEQTVTLVTLGTVVSEVKLDKEKITVPTSDLRWDTTADADEMLAVIKAHKTGEASLRVKASSKSTCIEKIDTNRIVLVLEKGKSFTKVLHEGQVGYIINTALTFYPVGGVKEGDAEPVPGWVSFRGKLNSRNTINIRQNGKNGSRILTDFIAGTPIMVFNQEGKWSEIDVGGYRAFILTEYVTLDTGEQTAEGE